MFRYTRVWTLGKRHFGGGAKAPLVRDWFAFGKGKKTDDPFETPTTPTNLGEDSFYAISSPGMMSFGVADGVGGWTEHKNGRPDLVAQHFMAHCRDVADAYANNPYSHVPVNPAVISPIVFAQAYERLQANPPGLGSCTGVVFTILPCNDKIMASSYLVGDSGFLLLRKEEDLYKVQEYPVFQRIG